MSDNSNCARLGLMINFPSIRPTLASDINVANGYQIKLKAADAAKPANASGITSSS
jgi:hypothetical protein